MQVTAADGSTQTIGLLTAYGNFNVPEGVNGYQFWRLLTYQFLHGGYVHLGMNMMALYVFGPLIEKWWGPKRFLAFYLLCGACGAWLMDSLPPTSTAFAWPVKICSAPEMIA